MKIRGCLNYHWEILIAMVSQWALIGAARLDFKPKIGVGHGWPRVQGSFNQKALYFRSISVSMGQVQAGLTCLLAWVWLEVRSGWNWNSRSRSRSEYDQSSHIWEIFWPEPTLLQPRKDEQGNQDSRVSRFWTRIQPNTCARESRFTPNHGLIQVPQKMNWAWSLNPPSIGLLLR